jgi:hypothetical protein
MKPLKMGMKRHFMKRIELHSGRKGLFGASLGAACFIIIGVIMLINPRMLSESTDMN